MKVKFKGNKTPCIQYEVIDGTPIMEYDEQFKRYCECIKIEVMGLVPLELLEETDCIENINAIDVAIELQSNKSL